jgi:hypothetical protein
MASDGTASSWSAHFGFQLHNIKSSSFRSYPTLVFNQSLCPMGCFASKPAVPPSPSTSSAPALRIRGPSNEANRDPFQAPVASSSRPNPAAQTPFLPSGPPGPPFAANVPQPPHKDNTTPALKPPRRKEEAPVSVSSLGAAGMSTSLQVQSNVHNNFRPYEHNIPTPAPSPYHSVSMHRSKSAQPLSQSGLPPQAVPASSPPHNDGMPMSRSHEFDRKRGAPSSYRPAHPVKRSISAQPLSQSELAAPSSHSMVSNMSEFESSSNPKSKDISRKLPRSSTLGTNRVHGAEDNGHRQRQFPSTVRTVLSDNLRYVPKCCLIIYH